MSTPITAADVVDELREAAPRNVARYYRHERAAAVTLVEQYVARVLRCAEPLSERDRALEESEDKRVALEAELAHVRVELVAAEQERDAVLAAHGELVVAATQLRETAAEAAEIIAKLQAAILERMSARGEA